MFHGSWFPVLETIYIDNHILSVWLKSSFLAISVSDAVMSGFLKVRRQSRESVRSAKVLTGISQDRRKRSKNWTIVNLLFIEKKGL